MGVLDAYRGVLRNRPLSRLLAGEFVSSIGDWLYLVALLVIVYRESDDPVLLGVVGAARVLPYVLLSIPAGLVADRYDRRLVLLVTDVARGAIMVALAVLVATDGPIGLIVALAILATGFSAFFSPAIGSYLPSLVTDERELGPANSAWSTLDNLAFIIGPAVGGLLIAASGLTAAFVINAISFAVVAVVLWRLPPGRPKVDEPDAERREGGSAGAPADAQRWRTAVRPVAGLVIADVTAAFAFGGLGVLTVILAVDRLGAGEEGTGYLNAAVGFGAVVGAVVSGALVVRTGLRAPLLAGSLVFGVGLAAVGLAPGLAVALIAMAVASGGSLVCEVASTTLFQQVVPDAVRGRALGITESVTILAYSAGSLLIPVATGVWDVAVVLVVSALVVVVGAIAGIGLIPSEALRAVPPGRDAIAERLAGRDVFAGVPAGRLAAALADAREQRVRARDAVVREGDPADRFYVIVDGRFEVTDARSPEPLRTLAPDDVFGEIGLLSGSPRTATVTAATDGRVLAIDAAAFLELVSSAPDLRPRLLALYRGRAAVR